MVSVCPGCIWNAFWVRLGASGVLLGVLGPSCEDLAGVLESLESFLGSFGSSFEQFSVMLSNT